MKKLILITLLFLFSFSAYSKNENPDPSFCEWLGDAATSVAQNRDNGVGEYDLISKYLSEGKSYGEQSVVIPLIDRVYGIEGNMSPEEIAFVEQQRCEIAFVSMLN
jgi:hypothetical protein